MSTFLNLNKSTIKLITSAGALALIAGLSLSMAPQAYATDCLLDTNNNGDVDLTDMDGGAFSNGASNRLACGDSASAGGLSSTALGADASAAGTASTAVGENSSADGAASTALGRFASSAGADSTALGSIASAAGSSSTAVGRSASAANFFTTALGRDASAAGSSATALGYNASAAVGNTTAVGSNSSAGGIDSTALGAVANAAGESAIALGRSSSATGVSATALGRSANAGGLNSVAVGADADDGNFDGAVVIGQNATATEADQVILKSADTFTILGNGDVGLGTATPMGNLDINSGADDTVLLLSNTSAQWELKSKAATGRLNFKNLTDGGVPFKLGPNSVNGLLSVGTMADDLVEVRGELMVEGDVEVTGTLTTGGPTCGGGCDAVFDADYDLPSIEEHARAMYANSYLPEIGPTVPKAAINVSERMGTMLNELEKAHIYIAQQQAEIARLKTLEGRIAELENLWLKRP